MTEQSVEALHRRINWLVGFLGKIGLENFWGGEKTGKIKKELICKKTLGATLRLLRVVRRQAGLGCRQIC